VGGAVKIDAGIRKCTRSREGRACAEDYYSEDSLSRFLDSISFLAIGAGLVGAIMFGGCGR
jgi:hypothetical protein